jgi:hypothetical protein
MQQGKTAKFFLYFRPKLTILSVASSGWRPMSKWARSKSSILSWLSKKSSSNSINYWVWLNKEDLNVIFTFCCGIWAFPIRNCFADNIISLGSMIVHENLYWNCSVVASFPWPPAMSMMLHTFESVFANSNVDTSHFENLPYQRRSWKEMGTK